MSDRLEALTDDGQLDDLEERAGPDPNRVDRDLLTNPVVVRALAGVVIASLVLLWPDRGDRILARLIGVGLVAVAGTSLLDDARSRSRALAGAAGTVVALAIGVALIVWPNQPQVVLARLVGAAIAATTARQAIGLIIDRRREPAPRSASIETWPLLRLLANGAGAALLLAYPLQVFAAATTLAALGWMSLSLVVIAVSLDTGTAGVAGYRDSWRLVVDWLASRSKAVDDRQVLYDKILIEGPATRRRLVRFMALMGFASVIASMGVITDSTAVVIGAMLIAPLMTPLMGMAISLVMGWPRRLARSALVAATGIVLAIAVGMVLGLALPAVVDTATNTQILGRASPTILDLITALAAGAAGAYGLSRPDVSDSLPGVAIAISLVPPLAVVGVAWSQGDWGAGVGALLLFATNMLAILVMGGLTFIITGVTPLHRVADNQHRVRSWLATLVVFGALVVGALFLSSSQLTAEFVERSTIEDAVSAWLEDHPDHGLVRIDLDGDRVGAVIQGPSDGAPKARDLAQGVGSRLERSVTVDVRLIVEERQTATAGG